MSYSYHDSSQKIIRPVKKTFPRHPYGTCAKTKIIEGVVDDLEQQREEFIEEMNQMKEKMNKMMEML